MSMKLPVQFVKKLMKISAYLDLFVWMLCRIDENLFFYWFLIQKSENFSVFRILAGRWKIPKAKPIVSQTLECALPQKFPTYGPRLMREDKFGRNPSPKKCSISLIPD